MLGFSTVVETICFNGAQQNYQFHQIIGVLADFNRFCF